MHESTHEPISFPPLDVSTPEIVDPLTQVLRRGAVQLLIDAVDAEVAAWIGQREHLLDGEGHRQVVRNGYASPRTIVTGV